MAFIRNPKDFYAGLLFIAFGVVALVIAQSYPVGSGARMGPGYFPRILGILLIALGALLSFFALRKEGEAVGAWHWKPLLIVLASVLAFALTAQSLGLVVATLAIIIISALASDEMSWKETLMSAVILSVFAVAVFVYGLGVQFPVWPPMMTGGA